MFKNVASQKIQLFAFIPSTGLPKTGDAANITAYVSKDHGTVTVLGDTSATELDATNAKGMYLFDLTQAETNGDELTFSAKSSTSDVAIVARLVTTLPTTGVLAPATAGRTLVVDAAGLADSNVIKAAGTAWASGAITAAVFATDAITASKVADDVSDEIRDKIVLRTTLRGTVGSGSTTTSVTTSAMSPATSVADQLKGRIVLFDHNTTTAALRGQATDITASSASATPTLTVTALTDMADTLTLPATSAVVATDDCSAGGHAQIVKLAISADGSATVIPADAGNGLDVDVTRLPALVAGTAYVGKVRLTDGTNDTSVSSTGALFVGGGVAHDDVDAGNPVKLGLRAVAHGSTPTAVAVADRTDWFANRAGVPFMIGGHPNLQSSEYYTTGAITDDNVLPAISTGSIYVITSISVMCSAANTVNTSVRIGFGATTVPSQGSTNADAVAKVVLSHPGVAPGSGVVKGSGAGIVGIGGDGEELRITCSAPTGGSLIVVVDWYAIAS
jgi:hypothetical protein